MSEQTIEILRYASIPFLAALVGWVTNWVAVKMTFYPLNFWGIKRLYLGWQGIIPRKARKIAEISVDSVMSKLGSISDIVEEIQPPLIAKHALKKIQPQVENYVNQCMMTESPELWKNLPKPFKQWVVHRVEQTLPSVVDELVTEITDNIEELLDLREMVVSRMGEDKIFMNDLFLRCGEQEFKFIVHSGLFFGFSFGLVQMVLWWLFPSQWVLPFFGLLVGISTNWLALNLIFRPIQPINVLGFSVQGLFLKRQAEVSEVYTDLVAQDLVTTERLANYMFSGPNADNVRLLMHKHTKRIVEDALGVSQVFIQGSLGMEKVAKLKHWVGNKAIALSIQIFKDKEFKNDRATAIRGIMLMRMLKLTSQEFQQMLRPAFKEDEWLLVLAGGMLGFAAGTAQLMLIFGQSLL